MHVCVLPEGILSDHQHIAHPTLFVLDSLCYLRLKKLTPEYNICIPNKIILDHIFEEFFDDVWDSNIDKNSHNTVVAMIQHAIHAIEIMLEVN